MNKRPKLVWNSQMDCVDAWLAQGTQAAPRAGTSPVGWARGWYRSRTLHFAGRSLWSIEWSSQHSYHEVEIARLTRGARGQWVVMVLDEEREWLGRARRTYITRWRSDTKGLRWVNVGQFEDHEANQRWYSENVARRHGKWQRARKSWSKRWRFNTLVDAVKQRAVFERTFGLTRTKEEPDVRTARVVQALLGDG